MTEINPFTQHYLEIAALDPAAEPSSIHSAATNPQLYITWPILAFFVFFVFVFSYFIHRKMKDVQSLLMVFGFAFLLAAIPIALQTNLRSTESAIKASPDTIPQNIIIQKLDARGFELLFETPSPTATAIRISRLGVSPIVLQSHDLSQSHVFVVNTLEPATTYYIEVLSDTTWYNHNGQPIVIQTPAN
jgi:hypothetical protein